MSEADNNQTKKKPTHGAFHVKVAGEQEFWNRIGSAWRHADGEGFNIQLDTIPIDGRIVIRPASK